jgi:hypothetical protein
VWVSSIATQARLLTRSKAPCGVCVQNGQRKLQRSNRSDPFRLADRRRTSRRIRVGHMIFRRPIAHRPARQAVGPLPILKLRQRCAGVRNTAAHPMSSSEATFRNIQSALRTRHSAGKPKVWCGGTARPLSVRQRTTGLRPIGEGPRARRGMGPMRQTSVEGQCAPYDRGDRIVARPCFRLGSRLVFWPSSDPRHR